MAPASAPHRIDLDQIDKQIRRWIIRCTSKAGSGHPTSSLSAVELMTELFFGGFLRFDVEHPEYLGNDRVIFSKGHASPLFYALWAASGEIDEADLMTYRDFGSRLEGHPTSRFRYTEAATGSLGQGLSVGLGMALAAKRFGEVPFRTFVLLGDSEMAEGSQWEAIQLAAHYRLNHLIGIIDVNRLGQRGETMYGDDLSAYQDRVSAFGWRTLLVEDGHDHDQIRDAYQQALEEPGDSPTMVIAKTIKGKGVSFLEDENGYHGKPVGDDQVDRALADIGPVQSKSRAAIMKPESQVIEESPSESFEPVQYQIGDQVATRDAYGSALCRIAPGYPNLVSLDGEVSNSTRSRKFAEAYPDRFFEMFVAEQNMVGAATGLALRGKLPFVSTFAAFLSRAFDQIRMVPYSDASVKFVGSHCGVSIGEDGPSQMGLEDIALFRTIQNGTVLYPCDAVSTESLVECIAERNGVDYLRTTRGSTPVIYRSDETFPIGGCKVLRTGDDDRVTLVGAGVTLHECLAAHDLLRDEGIAARVIDLYSIKPMDHATLRRAAHQTDLVVTVEDHFPEGGLGESVLTSLSDHPTPVVCLAVRERPLSGDPEQLLDQQGISRTAIVDSVRRWMNRQ